MKYLAVLTGTQEEYEEFLERTDLCYRSYQVRRISSIENLRGLEFSHIIVYGSFHQKISNPTALINAAHRQVSNVEISAPEEEK